MLFNFQSIVRVGQIAHVNAASENREMSVFTGLNTQISESGSGSSLSSERLEPDPDPVNKILIRNPVVHIQCLDIFGRKKIKVKLT